MSERVYLKMEDVGEAEENELLGGGEVDGGGDVDVGGDVDETAEDLMTDMKLEDDIDEVRAVEPDFNWSYHIEIYPWSADDMTENFVRLIKLAQFSQIYMRKKSAGKEADDSEKIDDKLQGRQRKGCLHFYTDNWLNAKNIMRSSTWKTMNAKELTFEITKRGPGVGQIESAYLELDTYTASKCRFRDKTKGELKDRSAKVSNLPGTISREFLDVVFSRAYAVIGGTTVKEYLKEKDGKLHEKLVELKEFNGSLDFDCLGRGSCRAFVLAHKNVYIEGQRISIEANDKETMVVPPFTHDLGAKKKPETVLTTTTTATTTVSSQAGRGRGNRGALGRGISLPARGAVSGYGTNGRGFAKESGMMMGRGRGMDRSMMLPQRPFSAPFSRVGPGMAVPMTGRQKMNEKMRRNNFGIAAATGGSAGGMFALSGGVMGTRAPIMSSVGDSFKQEIASLQSQLERSTQALEAKIAMLQQTTQAGTFFEDDMTAFESGDWEEGEFDYGDGYIQEDFILDDGTYANQEMQGFQFEPATPVRPRRPIAGVPVSVGASPALGHMTGPKIHQGPSRGAMMPGMRRGDMRGMRRGRGSPRGGMSGYW